ncbi:MAG: hypothetical protein HY810_04910 [Candidatus Omnitrophica bacterium]|nr:hypothetical protein [Candidatus Omnitrophota bacterium]
MVYINIVYIVLGILLLMLGRQLFWLFVAGIAFIAGLEYVSLLLPKISSNGILIISLIAAIFGLIMAFLVQRVGVRIAGFICGGYIALNIIREFGLKTGCLPWVIFLLGGIAGLILVTMLFDWALIILSSLSGAFFIISRAGFSLELSKILFVILVFIGIAVQASQIKETKNQN